ncbi:MAG: histidinol-phosphatase HisJ family protein [Clostridia bacterium]|nr:histidinol-phosphatase HisJ family protein [Clostridia bacterium]
MLSNIHTHSTFTDGKSTPEEIVISAIKKGFISIGFSEHSYGPHCTYGIKDTEAYIAEIKRLKEKYKNEIEVYLGLEEDMFYFCDRSKFEYIIGSCHYFRKDNAYFPIDSSLETMEKVLNDLYNFDVITLANDYYSTFCDYILKRKPDVIGHFDLITKFDENDSPLFFNNEEYLKLSEKYLLEALKADCIFEVNTGAISRGYRTTPYPYENLLYLLKKEGGKITLTSDSHHHDTLDCNFKESSKMLKDIGFTHTYVLHNNEFIKAQI